MKGEGNHRRNQIVAQRTAQKAFERSAVDVATETQLWEYVEKALTIGRRTAEYQGQVDNAVRIAHAQRAVEELRFRGIQLSLPL